MENEDVIREKMAGTRASMSEKLETLEEQVAHTVQGATSNVAETVEAVKETVETVKETVADTIATVKESVEETISTVQETFHEGFDAVKGMFDVSSLVEARPWLMFCGAMGAGFLGQRLLARSAPKPGRFVGLQPYSRLPDHYTGEDRVDGESKVSSPSRNLLQTFEPEINRLKGVALGALLSWVRDKVNEMVPEQLAPKLAEVMDSITQKLGGERLEPADGNREHFGNGRQRQASSIG